MGKDREGKFHPKKGKPSGSGRNENVGLRDVNTQNLDEKLEIAEKYTVGEEEPAPNIHVRHPNRNVDKKEERQRDKSTSANNDDNVGRSSGTSENGKEEKSRTQAYNEEITDTVPEELPAILNKDLFTELSSYQSSCCVSLYMPMHAAGVEVNEQMDSIAFKSALQQIAANLKQKGIEQAMIERMLKPGYDLLRNDSIWYNMSAGFAAFIADGYFRYIRLPHAPKNEVMINSSFFISPLIPFMTSSEYFYVLVLSKKQAKFYRADAFGIQYIPVPELPNGVDDVVHFEEKEDQKLFRTDTSGAGGGANFHGHGAGKPDEKKHIAMYFDEVDETLWKEILNKENVPLLLAGVEYLIPIYKSVAQYKNIWEDAITGSHEHDNSQDLYKQAREKLEPYFQEKLNNALKVYGNHSATELTSSVPADVIPAAHYGRVSHLFVVKDEHIWGSFDEMQNQLTIHETQQENDECLIDKAVIKTILTGGEVHIIDKEKMPADSKIAALMRY